MKPEIQVLIEEVEKFNNSIIETLDSKNISNTGEAANSLYINFGPDFVQSIGIFYLQFLDIGRSPGKFPPKKPIEDWVKTKLGKSESDSDFDGIVYVIRKKIAEIGTNIFINNNKGIELEKKIVTLQKAIRERLSEEVTLSLRKRIGKFKNIKYQI